MSRTKFETLVRDLCLVEQVPNADVVLSRGWLETDGFEIGLTHFSSDEEALYLTYRFGHVLAGRALHVFRLMLEANLTVYAQDQGQMGIEGDAGVVTLIVRVEMIEEVTGTWMSETLRHYTEHGRYWRKNILASPDEMFATLMNGGCTWIRS